jgi:hypothetical protein
LSFKRGGGGKEVISDHGILRREVEARKSFLTMEF